MDPRHTLGPHRFLSLGSARRFEGGVRSVRPANPTEGASDGLAATQTKEILLLKPQSDLRRTARGLTDCVSHDASYCARLRLSRPSLSLIVFWWSEPARPQGPRDLRGTRELLQNPRGHACGGTRVDPHQTQGGGSEAPFGGASRA